MGDQITLEDWLNEEIEVCDKCLRACCWHGLFMCDDSAIAGTIKKKRRDLVALGLEHSDYMVVDGESEHLYVTPKPKTTARELLEKVKNTQVDTYHQCESISAIGKIRLAFRDENVPIDEIIEEE